MNNLLCGLRSRAQQTMSSKERFANEGKNAKTANAIAFRGGVPRAGQDGEKGGENTSPQERVKGPDYRGPRGETIGQSESPKARRITKALIKRREPIPERKTGKGKSAVLRRS